MVFRHGTGVLFYGSTDQFNGQLKCDDNLNCEPGIGKAVVWSQTQPPCYPNTCIWATNAFFEVEVIVDFRNIGKQVILDAYTGVIRGTGTLGSPYTLYLFLDTDVSLAYHDILVASLVGIVSSNPRPQDGFYPGQNLYIQKINCLYGGFECVWISSNQKMFGQKLVVLGHTNRIPAWTTAQFRYSFFYEASPLLIADIDYEREYTAIGELRKTIGYKADLEHVGWNLDDIVRVAKQYLGDRPWIAIDDYGNCYLYGVTADDVRDILRNYYINKITSINANIDRTKVQELVNKYRRARGWTI